MKKFLKTSTDIRYDDQMINEADRVKPEIDWHDLLMDMISSSGGRK